LVVLSTTATAADKPAARLPDALSSPRIDATATKELESLPKLRRYADYLILKFDHDGDRRLSESERASLRIRVEVADEDRNGYWDREEIIHAFAKYGEKKRIGVPVNHELASIESSPSKGDAAAKEKDLLPDGRKRDSKFYVSPKRIPAGIPEWFVTKDDDGDGQLTAREYSPTSNPAELAEFSDYDLNGDGMLTTKEFLQKGKEKSKAVRVDVSRRQSE
jgi:hypothetical protein